MKRDERTKAVDLAEYEKVAEDIIETTNKLIDTINELVDLIIEKDGVPPP